MLAIAILAAYGWFLLAVYIAICLGYIMARQRQYVCADSFTGYVKFVSRYGVYTALSIVVLFYLYLIMSGNFFVVASTGITILETHLLHLFLLTMAFLAGYIQNFVLFSLMFLGHHFVFRRNLTLTALYMIVTSVLLFFLLPIGAIAMTFGFSF